MKTEGRYKGRHDGDLQVQEMIAKCDEVGEELRGKAFTYSLRKSQSLCHHENRHPPKFYVLRQRAILPLDN